MILLSAIGFGSYGVWSRFIGQDFEVFFQGWIRSAIVLLILIPIAFFSRNMKEIKKGDWKLFIGPVAFGVATQAPLYYAFNAMDIGTATLVFYSLFLITSYIIGRLFLNEKIGMAKLISLIMAFIGLALIFKISLVKFSLLALTLAAVNGIASGGEVATTKIPTKRFSSLQVSIYVWLGILITHLPLSILFGETQIIPNLNLPWLSMLCFSVIGLLSFWLVVEGFKYVDASIGGLIGLLEVVFGIVFGILFFQESLTISFILGGFIIIAAAMIPDLSTILMRKTKRV